MADIRRGGGLHFVGRCKPVIWSAIARRAATSETNFGFIFCNSTSRVALRQEVKVFGEVRVIGERWLNGDDNIARIIGDPGDWVSTVSVFAFRL